MVPLNAPIADAQQQHETATRAPHQLVDTDAKCKSAAAASCLEHSLATPIDSSSSSNSNSNTLATSSDAGTLSSRRPALSIQTGVHCLCGEDLCGFDCHFLQQEFQAFTAAELRHRRRRHENKDDRNDGVTSNETEDLLTSRKHRSTSNGNDSNSANNSSSDGDEAVADLERRFRRYYSSARSTMGFDDSTLDDMSTIFGGTSSTTATPGGVDGAAVDSDTVCLPARMNVRRSKSCGVHSSEFDQEQLVRRHNAYRLRIGYHDEALRERSEKNTQALLQHAMASDRGDVDSTTTILARKALRYRKVLERMEGVDVTDPSLDVSKCLGVHWQRVGSPEQ